MTIYKVFVTIAVVATTIFFAPFTAISQTTYLPPMDITLELSANFGEVRTNRFHSGIDLRTQGREGIAVKAVADGYISRVGVIPSGFGRVIYIAHPNGKTTVYGHLQRFSPDIERFATDERYRLKTNNLDAYLAADRFAVKAGQVIGYSGNSGISFGPHLHFELRNSVNQRTVEPSIGCGLRIPDSAPPCLKGLYYVAVDTVLGVPVHARPRRISTRKVNSTTYTTTDSSAVKIGPNGYFLVQAYDPKGGGSQNMAVRRIVQKIDGDTTLIVGVDGYLFDQTRYAASMTYYPMQKNTRYDIYRMAVQQGNHLPVYSNVKVRGAVRMSPGERHDVEMIVVDDQGLQCSLSFKIVAAQSPTTLAVAPTHDAIALHDKIFSFTKSGATITIPIAGLFETMFYTQSLYDGEIQGRRGVVILSDGHTLHNTDTPLNRSAKLFIATDVPQALRKNASLAIIKDHGKVGHAGGAYKDGGVSGSIRAFGSYCVVADTLAPTVVASYSNGVHLAGSKSITFTIKDNFSGIGLIRMTIDGKWALLERNVLKNTVTHHFNSAYFAPTGGSHAVILEVSDNCGNSTTHRSRFVR